MPAVNPNIELFNLICLRLLADLYEEFPVPAVVEPHALAASAVPKDSGLDETFDAAEIADETVNFLVQEGFISAQGSTNVGFYGVRLTMKGLAILGAIPVQLVPGEPREPLFAKISRVLGKGVETVTSETVQAVVSEVFKFALGSSAVVASGIMNA